MSTVSVLGFSRRCNVRGLTLLPQQFAGALPHGSYRVIGEEFVTYSDLGESASALMVRLERIGHDEIWFVGPQVVKVAQEAVKADRAYTDACLLEADAKLVR